MSALGMIEEKCELESLHNNLKSARSEEVFLADKVEVDEILKLEASVSDEIHAKDKAEPIGPKSNCAPKSFESSDGERHLSTMCNLQQGCNCAVCNVAVKDELLPDRQIDEERLIRCCVCNYSILNVNDLAGHLAKHEENRQFDCFVCDYTATEKVSLVKHMVIHSVKRPFNCAQCEYSTTTKGNLQKHMRVHKKQYNHDNPVKRKITDVVEKRFKCLQCKYSSNRSYNLKKHMNIHSKYNHGVLMKRTITDKLDKCFKCPQCEYSTKASYHLKNHMKIHIKLLDCGETYKSTFHEFTNLQKESSNAHENKPCFTCCFCSFETCKDIELSWHIKEEHTREKPFECTVCDYKTTRRRLLKNHMLIHNKEWPFQCFHCSYKSRKRSNLINHLTVHGYGKFYKCLKCEFSTSEKGKFRWHMQIHESKLRFACSLQL